MPKIVDHDERRDQIALVACRVVAENGFDQATIVRIAREAGYTTGMVAHYFDTKQDIIIAALRLILRRIEERLTKSVRSSRSEVPVAPGSRLEALGSRLEAPAGSGQRSEATDRSAAHSSKGALSEDASADLLTLLSEALPIDEQRHIECAFWTAFWGQVSADKRLKRINTWVHREYMRLFERCLEQGWPIWSELAVPTREQVLRSVVTFINGVTASAVASQSDWPAAKQVEQLRLQLQLLHTWASETLAAPAGDKQRKSHKAPSPGASAA